jgi:membrane-associated phospholipid phosphatase
MTTVSTVRDFGYMTVDLVPYLLPAVDGLIWLLTGDSHAFADIWFLLLNMGINFALRKLVAVVFGHYKWAYVPTECGIRCAARNPDFLQQCGGVVDMPSFHAQMVGHYTLYWLLVLAFSVDSEMATIRKVVAMVILLIAVYLLMYARYFIKCSTLAQLITGYIIGAIVGTLCFFLLHALVKATTGNPSYF